MESKKVQIFEHIQTFPGKSFSEIINDLQLSPSTVRFHLGTLERDNLITNSKIGKTRYFVVNENNENKIKACIENNAHIMEILQVIDSPKTLDEIFYKTKISKSLISKRLKVLAQFGFVEKKKIDSKIIFQKKIFK